jgi:hypothetical protein
MEYKHSGKMTAAAIKEAFPDIQITFMSEEYLGGV